MTIKGSLSAFPSDFYTGLAIYGQEKQSGEMTIENETGYAFDYVEVDNNPNPAWIHICGGKVTATGSSSARNSDAWLYAWTGIKCTDNATGQPISRNDSQQPNVKSLTFEICDHEDEDGDIWLTYEPFDEEQHTVACEWCGYSELEDCTFSEGVEGYDETYHYTICICGNKEQKVHQEDIITSNDGTKHGSGCGICGYITGDLAEHDYDPDGVCTICHFQPIASDSDGNLYGDTEDVSYAIDSGRTSFKLESYASGENEGIVDAHFSLDANGRTVELDMNGKTLSSASGEPLQVSSGTLKVTGDAVLDMISDNDYTDLNMNAIALYNGMLCFNGKLTATGGRGTAAVYASSGELDMRGNVRLDGGLDMTGSAELVTKLKAGDMFYATKDTKMNRIDVIGSVRYTTVAALLDDNCAFALCDVDGNYVDAGGNITDTPVIVPGNTTTLAKDVIVVAHEQHTFVLDESTQNYQCVCGKICGHTNWTTAGKCTDCGYVCAHEKVNETDGNYTCDTCKAQITIKITKDETVKYIAANIQSRYGYTDDLSLADAISAAEDGSTLTMLRDGVLAHGCVVGKSLTLNLNNKQMNGGSLHVGSTGDVNTEAEPGMLTLTGSGKIEGGVGTYVNPKGTLTTDEQWSGTLNKLYFSGEDLRDAEVKKQYKRTTLRGGKYEGIYCIGVYLPNGFSEVEIKLGDILADGYAFRYTDGDNKGQFVECETVIPCSGKITNVEVVPCTHKKVENRTCVYCGKTGIAAVSGKKIYASVKEALDDVAANGGEVKLYEGIDNYDSPGWDSRSYIEIDLNGQTVNMSDGSSLVLSHGTSLVIFDSSVDQNGKFGATEVMDASLKVESGCVQEITAVESDAEILLEEGSRVNALNIADSGKLLASYLEDGCYLYDSNMDVIIDPVQSTNISASSSGSFVVKMAPVKINATREPQTVPISRNRIPFSLSVQLTGQTAPEKIEIQWYAVKSRVSQGVNETAAVMTLAADGSYTFDNDTVCNFAELTFGRTYEAIGVLTAKDSEGNELWKTAVTGYDLKISNPSLEDAEIVFTAGSEAVFKPDVDDNSVGNTVVPEYTVTCNGQTLTEGEIKREQTQEQRTEKDSMYELSAKNDRLIWNSRKDVF